MHENSSGRLPIHLAATEGSMEIMNIMLSCRNGDDLFSALADRGSKVLATTLGDLAHHDISRILKKVLCTQLFITDT